IMFLFDFSWSWEPSIVPEVYASLIVVVIVLILGIIIAIKAKRTDPLAKPKGLINVVEIGVSTFDNMTKNSMGSKYQGMAPYWLAVAIYMFLAFTLGLIGLPTPMANIVTPLSLALVTFIMIHIVAMRAQKWRYFKRFIEPFPLFLPINLISMWSPLISLTFRLLGNALAGFSLMGLVYWALGGLSNALFGALLGPAGSIILPPLVTPFLHLYFDLFSAVIQIIVFISLSMMFIAKEDEQAEDVAQPIAASKKTSNI
ncbi:MAG: F0F1 ATP synthase subunit A, partial [Bacilli bacterium]